MKKSKNEATARGSLHFFAIKSGLSAKLFLSSCVKRGIECIEIPAVQIVLRDAERIAESLVVHKLPLAEILDGIAYVGIVGQPQNVVIGYARLVLCCNLVKARLQKLQ